MKKLNNNGMTLIEVLVSCAIAAIGLIMMSSGIAAFNNLWRENNIFISESEQAFNAVQTTGKPQIANISITIDGEETRYNSKIISQDIVSEGKFWSFSPQKNLQDIYYIYIEMGLDDLRTLGYTASYWNNDKLCEFIREKDYPSGWETIDINTKFTQDGTPIGDGVELYIRPHALFGGGIKPSCPEDIIVGALRDSDNAWWANLIFNHDDGLWYWKPKKSGSTYIMDGFSVANMSFPMAKKEYIDTGIVVPYGTLP